MCARMIACNVPRDSETESDFVTFIEIAHSRRFVRKVRRFRRPVGRSGLSPGIRRAKRHSNESAGISAFGDLLHAILESGERKGIRRPRRSSGCRRESRDAVGKCSAFQVSPLRHRRKFQPLRLADDFIPGDSKIA